MKTVSFCLRFLCCSWDFACFFVFFTVKKSYGTMKTNEPEQRPLSASLIYAISHTQTIQNPPFLSTLRIYVLSKMLLHFLIFFRVLCGKLICGLCGYPYLTVKTALS